MMKNSKMFKIIIISVVVILILSIIAVVSIFLMSRNNQHTDQNNISNESSEQSNELIDENATEEQAGDEETHIEYVETTDGSTIPVPDGFSYVEGTLSTGAVIEDEKGNQFVWVPTDNVLFARRTFENPNVISGDNENSTNTTNTSVSQSTNEVETQEVEFSDSAEANAEYIESVNKYNGFYIARFEASQDPDDETKASSVQGVLPLTEIVYDRMREIAQNTYADSNSVTSDITSSYTWDTLCEWLENSGYDIYNSTSYGNYLNNNEGTRAKAVTGRNSKWVTNNIYDLAGNVWEITTEEWGVYDKNHSGRGGGFHNDGINYPISCRVAEYDGAYTYIGFRLVLYLK